MRFTGIRARNFRNFRFLSADLAEPAHFIRGANGQGKTNLLEALGLVTSLRSFRTTDMDSLILWKCQPREAVLVYRIDHGTLGETELEIRLRPGRKEVLLDGSPVRQLKDMIGLFPTIPFSSQDIQLIRGAPALRRRLMDMMFVVMDSGYFGILTRYHKALRARNALLKKAAPQAQSRPFEQQLIESGHALSQLRRDLLETFKPHFKSAYAGISGTDESPELVYESSIGETDLSAYEAAFLSSLRRDGDFQTTHKGPHRDDLGIYLQEHPAREFASEGQQRGLVLSLRMGLVGWYGKRGGTAPVVLADDIVGELDPLRKEGFWKTLGTGCQIIATGTTHPREDTFHAWTSWLMRDGEVEAQ